MACISSEVLILPLLVALSGDKWQVPHPGERQSGCILNNTGELCFSPIAGETEHTSSQPPW